MNFRSPFVRCESPNTDLCRGGCPVMREWRALLARRRLNWKPAERPREAPARPQQEMQF